MPSKPKVTTLTIRESTRRRLAGYKRGDSTFDDLLNRFMDKVGIEDIMEEDIAEHYRILNDPKTVWYDGLEVADELLGKRKAPARIVRVGPLKHVSRDNHGARTTRPTKTA